MGEEKDERTEAVRLVLLRLAEGKHLSGPDLFSHSGERRQKAHWEKTLIVYLESISLLEKRGSKGMSRTYGPTTGAEDEYLRLAVEEDCLADLMTRLWPRVYRPVAARAATRIPVGVLPPKEAAPLETEETTTITDPLALALGRVVEVLESMGERLSRLESKVETLVVPEVSSLADNSKPELVMIADSIGNQICDHLSLYNTSVAGEAKSNNEIAKTLSKHLGNITTGFDLMGKRLYEIEKELSELLSELLKKGYAITKMPRVIEAQMYAGSKRKLPPNMGLLPPLEASILAANFIMKDPKKEGG